MMIMLVVLLCMSATALADDDPVFLDTSSVIDGQTDVPVDTAIELTFTNNVVNASVKAKNMECFELLNDGETVAFDITMADDQVNPELKRIITIVPQSNLEEGKTYKLIISGELTAKNGNKIGEDTIIMFTTEGTSGFSWYIAGAVIVIIAAGLIILVVRRRNGKK